MLERAKLLVGQLVTIFAVAALEFKSSLDKLCDLIVKTLQNRYFGLSLTTHRLELFWYCLLIHVYGAKFHLIQLFSKHRVFSTDGDSEDVKQIRQGQLAVVTGGGRGIGFHVVKKLVKEGFRVIVGCRSEDATELTRTFQDNDRVQTYELDLLSLTSVRRFAHKLIKMGISIRVLINNAGIMFSPYHISEDGFESHFQVNYFSHFYLTNLLMPLLVKAGTPDSPSRVVNVSSVAHFAGWPLQSFEEAAVVQREKYNPYKAYTQSKLLQIMSSNYWNAKLKQEGVPVTVNSVHPGIVATELYNNLLYTRFLTSNSIFRLFFLSPDQGADTVLYASISSEVELKGGTFFSNSQICEPSNLSKDPALSECLWEFSVSKV